MVLMDSNGDGLFCSEDFVNLIESTGEEERAKEQVVTDTMHHRSYT